MNYNLRVVSRKLKIANLPDFLLSHRMHDDQMSIRWKEEQERNAKRVREKYGAFHP